MKKTTKKLRLNIETVHVLDSEQLKQAVGGVTLAQCSTYWTYGGLCTATPTRCPCSQGCNTDSLICEPSYHICG